MFPSVKETFVKKGFEEAFKALVLLVGQDGIGPSTSFLSGRRSTTEPLTHSNTLHTSNLHFIIKKAPLCGRAIRIPALGDNQRNS